MSAAGPGPSGYLAGAGAVPDGSYDRATLLREPSGTELAFVATTCSSARRRASRAALDVAPAGPRRSPGARRYQQAAAGRAGRPRARRLRLGRRRSARARAAGGLLGALGVLLDQPALSGVTVSVSPHDGGARPQIHSALDPGLARVSAPRRAVLPDAAEPVMPAGATLLLDVRRARPGRRRGCSAPAPAAGSAGRIGPLLSRLGGALGAEGVNVAADRLDLLRRDGGRDRARSRGQPRPGRPALVIVARTSRPRRDQRPSSRRSRCRSRSCSRRRAAAPVRRPSSATSRSPGVTAHQLALAPGLQLDYAVFRRARGRLHEPPGDRPRWPGTARRWPMTAAYPRRSRTARSG